MHVIWIAAAARVLALKVMFKVLVALVKATKAGAVVEAGRTNAQEGVAEGKVMLPRVAMM